MSNKMDIFEKRIVNINGDIRERVIYQRHLAEDLFTEASGVITEALETVASGILNENFVLASQTINIPNPHYIYNLDSDIIPFSSSLYTVGTTLKPWAAGYFDYLYGDGSNLTGISTVTDFLSLTDTPSSYSTQGSKYVKVNVGETGLEFGDVTTTFLGLTDTPSSYIGFEASGVRVNAGGTGLEFVPFTGGGGGETGGVLNPVYVHTQASASGTWTVNHNLGTYNIITQVVDDSTPPRVVIPQEIEYTDINTATITFEDSYAGAARLIATIPGSSGSGGSGLSWGIISSDTNAVKDNGYLIDASSGNVTLTLPGSPVEGDSIGVSDYTNSATTNTITISRNGNKIEGYSEDLAVDIDGAGFTLVYSDSDIGWKVVTEISPSGIASESAFIVQVVDGGVDVSVGDGQAYFSIPEKMDGFSVVRVGANVITAGTTGTTDIQIHNVTNASDILTTKLTIDSGDTSSSTATTPAVIDSNENTLSEDDVIRIDVDAISTTAPKGLIVRVEVS